jgi:hypothetical protein
MIISSGYMASTIARMSAMAVAVMVAKVTSGPQADLPANKRMAPLRMAIQALAILSIRLQGTAIGKKMTMPDPNGLRFVAFTTVMPQRRSRR